MIFNLCMYIFKFQLAPKWTDDCDENKNKTNVFVVDTHMKTLNLSERIARDLNASLD